MVVRYKCVDPIENAGRAVVAGESRAAGRFAAAGADAPAVCNVRGSDAPDGRPATRTTGHIRGPRMATRYGALRPARLRAVPALGLALAMAIPLSSGVTGCASSKQPAQAPLLVATLPPPNFDGPDLAEPVPQPVVIKPKVAPPLPDFVGAPREWTPM